MDAMSLIPFGADIWRIGAISFENPSNDVIQVQTFSGLAERVLSNERVVTTMTPA
jgi:hypothetical protein